MRTVGFAAAGFCAVLLAGCGGGANLAILRTELPPSAPEPDTTEPEITEPVPPETEVADTSPPPEPEPPETQELQPQNPHIIPQDPSQQPQQPQEPPSTQAFQTHVHIDDEEFMPFGRIELLGTEATKWGMWMYRGTHEAKTAMVELIFGPTDTMPRISGTPAGSLPESNGVFSLQYEGRVIGRHNGGAPFAGTLSVIYTAVAADQDAGLGTGVDYIDISFTRFFPGAFARNHSIALPRTAVETDGSFGYTSGSEKLSGNLYGSDHEAAAGWLRAPDRDIGLAAFAGAVDGD